MRREDLIVTESMPTPPQAVEIVHTVEMGQFRIAIYGLDNSPGTQQAIPHYLRKAADAAEEFLRKVPIT